MTTRNLIDEFLSVKRFALVGISRKKEDFSRRLFDELIKQGYDVVPVNPNAPIIEGRQCFTKVKEVAPPVTSALVITPPSLLESVLRDCADGGVTLVWIYGISGAKKIPPAALAICEEHGMEVVPGYCPFMFMPVAAFFHRLHGTFLRIMGKYPH